MGNIDVANSGEGSINMYTVDLYDTSTPVDVNIAGELVKSGYAWPDPWLLPSEEAQAKSAAAASGRANWQVKI